MNYFDEMVLYLFAYRVILHAFCHLLIFFNITFFKKKSGIPSVSNSLDPDQAQYLLGLIRIQAVCKGYQQPTLVGNKNWAASKAFSIPATSLCSSLTHKAPPIICSR